MTIYIFVLLFHGFVLLHRIFLILTEQVRKAKVVTQKVERKALVIAVYPKDGYAVAVIDEENKSGRRFTFSYSDPLIWSEESIPKKDEVVYASDFYERKGDRLRSQRVCRKIVF